MSETIQTVQLDELTLQLPTRAIGTLVRIKDFNLPFRVPGEDIWISSPRDDNSVIRLEMGSDKTVGCCTDNETVSFILPFLHFEFKYDLCINYDKNVILVKTVAVITNKKNLKLHATKVGIINDGQVFNIEGPLTLDPKNTFQFTIFSEKVSFEKIYLVDLQKDITTVAYKALSPESFSVTPRVFSIRSVITNMSFLEWGPRKAIVTGKHFLVLFGHGSPILANHVLKKDMLTVKIEHDSPNANKNRESIGILLPPGGWAQATIPRAIFEMVNLTDGSNRNSSKSPTQRILWIDTTLPIIIHIKQLEPPSDH